MHVGKLKSFLKFVNPGGERRNVERSRINGVGNAGPRYVGIGNELRERMKA